MKRKELKKIEKDIINDNVKRHIEADYEKGVTYYINVSENKKDFRKWKSFIMQLFLMF